MDGLENRWSSDGPVGSNPTTSAISVYRLSLAQFGRAPDLGLGGRRFEFCMRDLYTLCLILDKS